MNKLIPFVMCILLLCGCSGYKEINNGYLVTAIAFEKTENGVKINASAFLPVLEENIVLQGTGGDFNSAFNELKRKQVKTLYFEHCGTVVLNQNFKDEALTVLEFCKNKIKVPIAARVILCNDAKALFEADKTGYDVISLLKNNNYNGEDRLYKIEQKGEIALPFVTVNEKVISFEGEIK